MMPLHMHTLVITSVYPQILDIRIEYGNLNESIP